MLHRSSKSVMALAYGTLSRMYNEGPVRLAVLEDQSYSPLAAHLVKKGCILQSYALDVPYSELSPSGLDGVIIIGNGSSRENGQLQNYFKLMQPLLSYIRKAGLPVLGIGLGHQLLALSQELPVRVQQSRGRQRIPLKNRLNGKIEIKEFNSDCFIGLRPGDMDRVAVTHININEHHVEGVQYKQFPGFGVQYMPDPSDYLLNHFIELLRMWTFKNRTRKIMAATRHD